MYLNMPCYTNASNHLYIANKHGVVYNELKKKFMCLKPAVLKNIIYVPNVELNGKTLELVKREKYLGFFVPDSFYDDEYTKNEIGNTYARGNIRHFKTLFC